MPSNLKNKKNGRPSKYKKTFCKVAIDLMKDGASRIEVCAAIDISYLTFYEWVTPESRYYIKQFSDAIKKGELLSQAWWEKKGRTKLEERDFNSTLWFMNVKNRFRKSPLPWSDKTEVDVNNKHSFENKTDDEIDNKIKAMFDKLNANGS